VRIIVFLQSKKRLPGGRRSLIRNMIRSAPCIVEKAPAIPAWLDAWAGNYGIISRLTAGEPLIRAALFLQIEYSSFF